MTDHEPRRQPNLLNRLRRANGHLAGIIKMVEDGGDGPKIVEQMQAVVALEKIETLIITDHIEHQLGRVLSQTVR